MNTNFKLLTTETFESVYCDFYYNANDEILVSREQIGKALGYANPQKAIQKVHLKHRDRLESLCVRIVENCKPQNGGVGVDVETVYYTQRGIMEICRWSRQPKCILLEEYFNITRGQLYRNILLELENLYDLDTQQIQADYCYENNINSCYPLEPYEFVPKYRDMIEDIVNSNLIKYGITSETDPIASTKHITIFDTPIVDNAREVD